MSQMDGAPGTGTADKPRGSATLRQTAEARPGAWAPQRYANYDRLPLSALRPSHLAVLSRLVLGESNTQIAGALGLTQQTVKSYLSEIYTALCVPNRAAAVALTLTWLPELIEPQSHASGH